MQSDMLTSLWPRCFWRWFHDWNEWRVDVKDAGFGISIERRVCIRCNRVQARCIGKARPHVETLSCASRPTRPI